MIDELVHLIGAEIAMIVAVCQPQDPYEARAAANAYAAEHLSHLRAREREAAVDHAVALLAHAMQWAHRSLH